ncbi:hypothetical protein G3N95_16040 [Paraburkholderia sp. Tr-20389]|uniref:hypothetical protein n=1 Tax=Paraburkholderia sp. Tr-20389 TaxID=2703903 RepID=UPI00197F575D|nr:hypothetical protein [Paraburkholderia sp. Tr-20389]MBN3754461.1 hypothetical protein [Paraburkholderia sp. Tr-20389]
MNVSGIQTGLVTSIARDPQTPDASQEDAIKALLDDLAPMLDRAFNPGTAATASALPSGTSASGASTSSTPASTSSVNAQQGGTDLENAMSSTQAKDPTLFAKTMKDAQSGDGNALVEDELQAYKEGAITRQQAIEEVSGAQKMANDHGGGKINGHVKSDAQDLLGGSYIKGGQTRAGHAVAKFFESFNPIGAIVKGVKDKTSKPSEDILSAAQPALSQGVQRAMADMQAADPMLAQKFQQDASKGDGNAMVDDMVSLKNEQQSGAVPNTFSDQDAQLLGSQVGALGKGKVNSTEDQKFAQAFGTDTLYRGSSAASKTWNKIEDSAGNFMQQIVSPVTDTVGGAIDLVHGNIKGALSEFGQAFVGAATDAAMVVAPEAAPEVEAGVMAARGGVEAAKIGTTSDSAVNGLMKGAKLVDKSNDYANHANDAINYLTGDNSNGNTQQVG